MTFRGARSLASLGLRATSRGARSLASLGLRATHGRLRWITAALLLGFLPPTAHWLTVASTRIPPPHVVLPAPDSARAWTRVRAGLREVYLEGSPEQIGASESRLLYARMVADEGRLWGDFEKLVPLGVARLAIEDLSRLRYRHVDRAIPSPRLRELAAESLAFQPDPFGGIIPTYHRMVFLHALYDIALSFERSPLIGCSTFAIGPTLTEGGHVLVGRAFDMETDPVLDRDKAVFLVREEGAIPYVSVAWPGFIGAVTGMNEAGVFVVVHGGRAREPRAEGLPVAFSLREVLARARDTREAVALLRGQEVMVSHIVFVADGLGRFATVERAPGVPAYVREAAEQAVVTNHFQGPLSGDPKNRRVLSATTSVARADRLAELLAGLTPGGATLREALAILRDHKCAGRVACALGDRRAIDALIATHGVIADPTDVSLWVGVGPNLSGKFVRVDVRALLAPGYDPSSDPEPETLPEDPILLDGRYQRAKEAPAPEAPR